jgi:hypothetical protein
MELPCLQNASNCVNHPENTNAVSRVPKTMQCRLHTHTWVELSDRITGAQCVHVLQMPHVEAIGKAMTGLH